ncbi:MAG TPA: aquaporin Z [Terriglobales bacterium]|nr:aquaporin Z [Terriglobales bacterium]
MSIGKRSVAEFVGTFWLVFGGCGSAVLAAAFPGLGIGFAGVALAFGLTLLTMAYTIGPISGCHINPAVTVGLAVGKRFPGSEVIPYVIAQVAGAIAAAGVLYVIASGSPNFDITGGFASNGYGAHSPGQYPLLSCLVAEVVLTAFFLIIIMGVTDDRAPKGVGGPIAIGLALTLIHLVAIPVTNTSVNPARSTGPALFVGGWALRQLWLFWVAPILGGTVGAGIYAAIFGHAEPAPATKKAAA